MSFSFSWTVVLNADSASFVNLHSHTEADATTLAYQKRSLILITINYKHTEAKEQMMQIGRDR